MLSDGTVLQFGEAEVQSLELDSGDPDGRGQVALAAPNDHVSTNPVAASSGDNRRHDEEPYDCTK
ncbi:MAG: hypothetical protein JWM85_3423 [Acidimicrobiaceae bacterium]|nr:hypothetical protein [Acidimicrobiaceae bacterium]